MTTAYDGNIESLFCDLRLDRSWSNQIKLSPEMQELHERYMLAKTERQSMSVASGLLSLACPIMPLGFLASFFLLGRLDSMDKGPLALARGRGLAGQMARIAAAEALSRKKKEHGEEDPDGGAYLRYVSRQLELRPIRAAMRPLRGSEQKILPKNFSGEKKSFFITKDKQQKKQEIKKQKILLESLMEKSKQENNFAEFSRLSSKLELLDKLLKKLGAAE